MIIPGLTDPNKTLVMGILNMTPDSFYDGSRYNLLDKAIKRAEEMIEDETDIIDIGGESSRPGSEPISQQEELERVIPVIREVSKRFKDAVVSIDTYKSEVAKAALDSGAKIVNDISGMRFDSKMPKLISQENVPVVIMHMQGNPGDMQDNPRYENLIGEITNFFKERIDFAVDEGIDRENIIIDPGIGFGKTTGHNLEILRNLRKFTDTGQPVLLGTSRKSFIGKILGSEKKPLPAERRLEGSLVTYLWAVLNGVRILRVHDTKETRNILKMLELLIAEEKTAILQ